MLGAAAIAAAVSMLLAQGAAAAGMRVSGPTVVRPGQTCVLTVEAENTGLGGQPTDGAQWRLVAPSYLAFDAPAKPAAADDFFETRLMDFEAFPPPPSLCGRLVYTTGGGPVNRGWSELAVYQFRVDYSGDLPHTDSLSIKARDSLLMSPSGSAQWTADADIPYTFTIVANTPPSVELVTPSSGWTTGQGSVVNLVATAGDTDGSVTSVEFYDGAVRLGGGSPSGGTWVFGWDTAAAALGFHTITARATDDSAATAASSPKVLTVCIAGDANSDGSVDGLDYNAWQNGYNSPAPTFSSGDFNGDGSVDGLDYSLWQNNYAFLATYTSDAPGGGAVASADPAPPAADMPVAAQAAGGSAPRLIAVSPVPGRPARDVRSISLGFDSEVQAGAGAVEVSGQVRGPCAFVQEYDPAARTIRIVFSAALPPDRYTVRIIADFVTAADGAPLDGEVGDAADPALPSGDGRPGGDVWLDLSAE